MGVLLMKRTIALLLFSWTASAQILTYGGNPPSNAPTNALLVDVRAKDRAGQEIAERANQQLRACPEWERHKLPTMAFPAPAYFDMSSGIVFPWGPTSTVAGGVAAAASGVDEKKWRSRYFSFLGTNTFQGMRKQLREVINVASTNDVAAARKNAYDAVLKLERLSYLRYNAKLETLGAFSNQDEEE